MQQLALFALPKSVEEHDDAESVGVEISITDDEKTEESFPGSTDGRSYNSDTAIPPNENVDIISDATPDTENETWGYLKTTTDGSTSASALERLVHFITVDKPGLVKFFPGDLNQTLMEYAQKAEHLAEELMLSGCPREIAFRLGVLTLYDLVMLIGM